MAGVYMNKIDPIVYVLRNYRHSIGISQDDMSKKTGISRRTLQRIEAGNTDMKLSQYRQYLRILGISDMDVSIALFSHDFVTEREISAVIRKLPLKIKQAIIQFLIELSKNT